MRRGSYIVAFATVILSGCLTKGSIWKVAEFESQEECKKVVFAAAKRFETVKINQIDAKPSCKRISNSLYEGKIRTGTNFGPGHDYLGKTDDIRLSTTPEDMKASWSSK